MAVTFDYSDVNRRMEQFKSKFDAAVSLLCQNGSQKMEQYAKEHRPWKDRTGDARRRLNGSWKKSDDGYVIAIAHGVDYGVYLEMKNERRYAILLPTVEKIGKGDIIPAFQNFIERLNM